MSFKSPCGRVGWQTGHFFCTESGVLFSLIGCLACLGPWFKTWNHYSVIWCVFTQCTQDSYPVASITEHLLQHLKTKNPSLESVHLRSDEAGCYHSNFLIAAVRWLLWAPEWKRCVWQDSLPSEVVCSNPVFRRSWYSDGLRYAGSSSEASSEGGNCCS